MRGLALLIIAVVTLSAMASWPHDHRLVLRPTGPIPAANVP